MVTFSSQVLRVLMMTINIWNENKMTEAGALVCLLVATALRMPAFQRNLEECTTGLVFVAQIVKISIIV